MMMVSLLCSDNLVLKATTLNVHYTLHFHISFVYSDARTAPRFGKCYMANAVTAETGAGRPVQSRRLCIVVGAEVAAPVRVSGGNSKKIPENMRETA